MTNLFEDGILLSRRRLAWNKFVISTGGVMSLRPTQDIKNAIGPATTLHVTTTLSFVIPSEAEGSAVPRTSHGNT
jgi:hypothetical protein